MTDPIKGAEHQPHKRVLIIDDNIDMAESLRDILELDEYITEMAYSGVSGLAKAGEFKPDAILCDIGLPDMDGYTVAQAIRKDEQLKHVFLIALTGYTLPEDLQKAQDAGFDRHIAKPMDPEELLRLLSEAPKQPV